MNFFKKMLFILALLCFFIAAWTIAYFIIDFIYRGVHIHTSEFIKLSAAEFLDGILVILTMFTVGKLAGPKRMQFFHSIKDALEQIAKGNFNVQLNLNSQEAKDPKHPFGQLIRSVNKMAADLGELESMRQEFISNISHEIQSPLTSIGGFARALRSDKLKESERLHYLDIIETETRRLSKLSENLMKLTSLESENHRFEPEFYRLDKQLRRIVLSFEPQWREKDIEMDVSLEEVTIEGDEDLLSQLWVNLLHNSIKFTPNGGTINVMLKQANQHAVVQISDNGIGITPEEQSRIFERFYKADPSRHRTDGGSGLGLSIVKKITDIHGGLIEIESEPGEGSLFTVQLQKKVSKEGGSSQ